MTTNCYRKDTHFDRSDESELAILPQKFDRSPELWSKRICDDLRYGFDSEQIRGETNLPS